MRKTFLTLTFIMLHSILYSQLVNYNENGKIKILTAKTTLTETAVDVKLLSSKQSAVLLLAAGTILPPVIDYIGKSVTVKAKKNALAYQGEYKGSLSGDKFYMNKEFASLPKLLLTRTIKMFDGKDVTATQIEFIPELSADYTAFRYYVKEKCIYNYSIAKTKGNYDYIDLDIEIKYKNLFVTKDEYKLNDLRTTIISIPMIKVGQNSELPEKYYSGWIPLPTRSMGKVEQPKPLTEDKTLTKTDNKGVTEITKEKTSVIKSNAEEHIRITDNTGLYEVEITVKETNPYKIKAENKQVVIESSSEAGAEVIKAVINVLTKEKDEKKENADDK